MSEPFLIVDHVLQAIANLVSDYDDATKVQDLVSVFVNEVQELENTFYDLITDRLLDTSVGAQLDTWGEIVGERRDGLTDDEFREFIRARILTNLAEGEIQRIITVLKTITQSTLVKFQANYPAAFIVDYSRDGYTSDAFRERVRAQILSITPSGVGLKIVESNLNYFGFADDPNALGFGDGEWSETV
jgi:hypothetical protein